jgi:hypothetical protein
MSSPAISLHIADSRHRPLRDRLLASLDLYANLQRFGSEGSYRLLEVVGGGGLP